jgi:selT/selW/selH-like putative selenoprotein
MKVAHILQEHGRGRLGAVEGELYPPPYFNALASQLLSYTFYLGLFLVVLGDWFFTNVIAFEPALKLVRFLKNNQLLTMVALMGCNMIAANLLSTGAFEVFYNGQLVYSKLQTGQPPDINFLLERFRNFQTTSAIPGDEY